MQLDLIQRGLMHAHDHLIFKALSYVCTIRAIGLSFVLLWSMTYLQLQPIINICTTGWAGTLCFFPEDIMEQALQFLHDRVEQTHFDMAGLRLLGGTGRVKGVA